jgi:hypothetical protein
MRPSRAACVTAVVVRATLVVVCATLVAVCLSCLVPGQARGDAGQMFLDPEGRYYVSLPEGWRATAGTPYVVCRPAGRSDVSVRIAVLPTTNWELDRIRLNEVADLWRASVRRAEPHLRAVGQHEEATYFNRPAVHIVLRGRPARGKAEQVRRLTVITCRGYAYFISAEARSPESFDEYRPDFDALLESLTDLSPSALEKVLLVGPTMKLDPYKVPVHDFALVNRNDFTVDNVFIKVDYHTVQETPLESCLVRVNVRIHPGERLVVRNFQALPLRPTYDYSHYDQSSVRLVDVGRAFDQGMATLRAADSIVLYDLDLGGAERTTSPNDAIAYCRGSDLWLMDGRGRRTWRLYTGTGELRDPAWSPNRERIVVAEGGSLTLLELDRRGKLKASAPLLPEERPTEFVERHWFSAPTWVRDGATLLCMGHKLFRPLPVSGLSTTRRSVVTRITTLSLATLSTDQLRIHANPDDFSKRFESFDAVVYCSPRSDMAAYTRYSSSAGVVRPGEESELVFVDFTGKVLKAVPVQGLVGTALAWSPDGRHVAFLRRDSRGATNVCVLSLRDKAVTQLTSLAPIEGRVAALDWSPDGSWIVFEKVIAADRSRDLFKVHTRGRTVVRLTRNGVSGSPAWFGR